MEKYSRVDFFQWLTCPFKEYYLHFKKNAVELFACYLVRCAESWKKVPGLCDSICLWVWRGVPWYTTDVFHTFKWKQKV